MGLSDYRSSIYIVYCFSKVYIVNPYHPSTATAKEKVRAKARSVILQRKLTAASQHTVMILEVSPSSEVQLSTRDPEYYNT